MIKDIEKYIIKVDDKFNGKLFIEFFKQQGVINDNLDRFTGNQRNGIYYIKDKYLHCETSDYIINKLKETREFIYSSELKRLLSKRVKKPYSIF